MKLLLIDQGDTGNWLANHLSGLGFIPDRVSSVQQAIHYRKAEHVQCVIAESSFQGHCADALVRPLRRAGINQPLMVLSPIQDWREMIECLDAGADDFVVKPARSDVIAARMRAIIRRKAGNSSDRIAFGDIEIDLRANCGWKQGRCLDLTRNEFRLLRLLLLEPDRVLSHDEIRGQLYVDVNECSQNAIEVLVARLRRKVGRERIGTVRGVGYRFRLETDCSKLSADKPEPHLHGEDRSEEPAKEHAEEADRASRTGSLDAGLCSWFYAI